MKAKNNQTPGWNTRSWLSLRTAVQVIAFLLFIVLFLNWRPLLMLTCIAIIANNYLLNPYLKLFFAAAPLLELPDALWELLKIGVGGYVVGRSVEKGIDLWRNGASSEARGAK